MSSDFDQLIREHGARIRRIARRYAAPGAADDLVQDILVRLWRSYPRFRGDARVETWVYRISLNACMTHLAISIREREGRAALVGQSRASSAPPEATGNLSQVLAAFLEGLGDIDASVLMMYLDGLSTEEMSGVLGISPNAVAVRITRLRQKFSDLYVE